jgi:carbon-monoxide dehydrogenase small subunit
VRHGLNGNLCRCTGYTQIVESILNAAEKMHGN